MESSRKTIEQTITQRDVLLLAPIGNLWKVANDIVECEVQVDCNFEGINWDMHTIENPNLLTYIRREARSLTADEIVFLLESIPYREGEETFQFYFGVNRGLPPEPGFI